MHVGTPGLPRGLSGSGQMVRAGHRCAPNMPTGAPGNCAQHALDRPGEPLHDCFHEGCALTEICSFAAGFRSELGNNVLMAHACPTSIQIVENAFVTAPAKEARGSPTGVAL
jgi:hypothetical protein